MFLVLTMLPMFLVMFAVLFVFLMFLVLFMALGVLGGFHLVRMTFGH